MLLWERLKKLWFLAFVTLVIMLYVLFAINYDVSIDTWQTRRFDFANGESYSPADHNDSTKKILFWNTMFGDETFYFGKGKIFKNCPGISKNCWATHDRTVIDIEDFDAVLIHGSDLTSDHDVPQTRRVGQRYVFVNLESPENRPILFKKFDNDFFNVTMTYRLDSDVVWSYSDIRKMNDGRLVAPKSDTVWNTRLYEATGTQIMDNSYEGSGGSKNRKDKDKTWTTRKKTKTAAWLVSNCHTKSKREKYVDELALHVDVDIFGSCGKSGCPKGEDCFRKIFEPNYYFYLSFENSMCQDYVTEKLYNALKYDVVPIVYGGANYSRFSPPKSYINALDFNSPKELADYLKRLIREPKEYEKYFEWKEHYRVVKATDRVICDLCQFLHENNATKSYAPLSTWYKSDKCPLQEKLQFVPYLTKRFLKS